MGPLISHQHGLHPPSKTNMKKGGDKRRERSPRKRKEIRWKAGKLRSFYTEEKAQNTYRKAWGG